MIETIKYIKGLKRFRMEVCKRGKHAAQVTGPQMTAPFKSWAALLWRLKVPPPPPLPHPLEIHVVTWQVCHPGGGDCQTAQAEQAPSCWEGEAGCNDNAWAAETMGGCLRLFNMKHSCKKCHIVCGVFMACLMVIWFCVYFVLLFFFLPLSI